MPKKKPLAKKSRRQKKRQPKKVVEKAEPYGITSPCNDCPFRTDVKPYLTERRVEEIRDSLVRAEFPCHKTVNYDNADAETGEVRDPGLGSMHCAGALILLEKEELPSQMMRICERIGMYDATKLNMDAPVYDTWEDMIAAQPKRGT